MAEELQRTKVSNLEAITAEDISDNDSILISDEKDGQWISKRLTFNVLEQKISEIVQKVLTNRLELSETEKEFIRQELDKEFDSTLETKLSEFKFNDQDADLTISDDDEEMLVFNPELFHENNFIKK